MSRPNTIICDRCGKEITETRTSNYFNCKYGNCFRTDLSWAKLHIWPPDMQKGVQPQRTDLCGNCFEDFIKFMENYNESI